MTQGTVSPLVGSPATLAPGAHVQPMAAGSPALTDPLAGLRGYHLPAAPSWWPPAPGWWVLAGLALLLLTLLVWWWLRRARQRAALRLALAELAQLRRRIASDDRDAADLRALSRLLRRYAIATFPGQPVAALTGEQWLAFLDRHGGGERFREGPGRLLLDAPYRPVAPGKARAQAGELLGLVEDWIRRNPRTRQAEAAT